MGGSSDCPLFGPSPEARDCSACTHGHGRARTELLPKQLLHLEGDPATALYGVIDGFLRETRTLEDGRIVGLRIVRPGDLVGTEALARESYQCTVEALTGARLCRATLAELARNIEAHPSEGLRLSRAVEDCASRLRDGMVALGSMSAEERVKSALYQLIDDAPPGTWVTLPLTRKELGELLGLALATVSRTIQRLARSGQLEVRGRRVRLPPTKEVKVARASRTLGPAR